MKIFFTLVYILFNLAPLLARGESGDVATSKALGLIYDQDVRRSHFALGFETVQISSSASSILGFGPRAGFEFGLDSKLSIGATMTFAFAATGKPGSYFYSGLNGLMRYSFTGSTIKVTDNIFQAGRSPIYSGKVLSQKRLSMILGFEQLFLNGATSIYPAVGTTLGGSYGGIINGYEVEFDLRISKLIANDNPLSLVGIGANINLDFL